MWGIYRTKAALQVNVINPTFSLKEGKDGKKYPSLDKYGSIYFEAAEGQNRSYDWSKKVSFALSYKDLPMVYLSFKNYYRTGELSLKLLHDPNAHTENDGKLIKNLMVSNKNTAIYFNIVYSGSEKRTVSVPMGEGELILLHNYIMHNQNRILGEEYSNATKTDLKHLFTRIANG